MFSFIYLIIFITFVSGNHEFPKVQITSGFIEGEQIFSTVINKSYYSFKGIPYAEPPVGKLRFQSPIEIQPWTHTLQTKTDGSQCVQKRGGSENCLFLNVYTPSLPSEEKKELLPVMVFIHGGAFIHGSAASKNYGPDYLVDKNVVLVTMNYRLNVFGFLTTMDASAPGNAGLKDIVFSLKWVQKNINKFNGNPKDVTLFGHSAGSAATQYFIHSNLTKDLFHKAIMQSGSSLNSFALNDDPSDLIHKLAKILKIEYSTNEEIIQKLQNVSTEELFNASLSETIREHTYKIIEQKFTPTIEYDSPNAIISKSPYSLLQNYEFRSIPLMIGYVSNEALFFEPDISSGKHNLEQYKNNASVLITKSLNIKDPEIIKTVWHEIKNYYFKDLPVTNVSAFINLKSDDVFVRAIRKSLEFLREKNDIYFYIFGYKSKNNKEEYSGVPHVGELKYLFYTGAEETKDDKLVSHQMTTLWTNFAKTGNPTPNNIEWPLVSRTGPLKYLNIEKQLSLKENPGQDNFEFWDKIFKSYGNPPFLTY